MEIHFGIIVSLSLFLYAGSYNLCEDGWLDHAGSCFTFITGSYHWQTAEEICRSHKANLASIHTFDRQLFIYRIARMLYGMQNVTGSKNYYWIGARDYFIEGEWRWDVGGRLLDSGYTNWASGHPKQSNNKTNCAYFAVSSSFWYNSGCSIDRNGALCEKSVNFTIANSMFGFGR